MAFLFELQTKIGIIVLLVYCKGTVQIDHLLHASLLKDASKRFNGQQFIMKHINKNMTPLSSLKSNVIKENGVR